MKVLQRIFNSLFLLVGLFLSFSACTDDNDVTATLLDKEYELIDIEWCRMADDVLFSKEQSFTHESTSQQEAEGKHSIDFNAMEGYRQSSLFLPDDPVLFQRLIGLAAYIEGTVKGDRHALRGFEQLLHQGDVDIAFGRQAAEDYAVGSQPVGIFDVLQHDALFKGSVEEITSAWADDDVQARMHQ